MIALEPIHDAVAVADELQPRLESRAVAGIRRRQHGFAERHAIEGILTHHEFFRPARPTDERVALVTGPAQRGGNEFDALRNVWKRARLAHQALEAPFRCEARADRPSGAG